MLQGVVWFLFGCGVSCCVTLLCIAGFCRVPPCGMLCSRCFVWCVVARCVVLGCAVVVVCGCVRLQFVVVFTLCGVVWGRSASWYVVFGVGTWWVPQVKSIVVLLCCAVFPCVPVLCCVLRGAARCRGVRFCVLCRGWFGVNFCLVVLCGVVACLVRFVVVRCLVVCCVVLYCCY